VQFSSSVSLARNRFPVVLQDQPRRVYTRRFFKQSPGLSKVGSASTGPKKAPPI
jgi:hypothetical protein